MSRRLLIFLLVFLTTLVGTIFFTIRVATTTVVFENGTSIEVEVVRTWQDQERGLAGHAPLDDHHGMLFVWNEAAPRTFWMKGMTFPIDIIWIKNGKIIGIQKQVPTLSAESISVPTYSSADSADIVLEVAAGFTDRHWIELGQVLLSGP